jgi:hypothetical protein
VRCVTERGQRAGLKRAKIGLINRAFTRQVDSFEFDPDGAGSITMNRLRRVARHEGLAVCYFDDMTEEKARRIDDLVRKEFESGEWVTVEEES